VLCQLSYAPRFDRRGVYRRVGHHPGVGSLGLAVLFLVLTCAFAVIAVDAGLAGRWVIAVAAGVLGAWMASFAFTALRKRLR
jgi:hypothetical protein